MSDLLILQHLQKLRKHNNIFIFIFFTMFTLRQLFMSVSCLSLALVLTSCGSTPEEIKAKEVEKQVETNLQLMEKVGSLMILPNEEPIIASINEAEALRKEQPFYNGVENGDQLIVFPKAQKAVIYSPSKNVIVNSGPFTINDAPKK
jgi:hypothetical protein